MPRDSKNPTNEAQQRLSQASCHQEICAEPKHQHQNGVPMKNDNMKRQRKSERRLDLTLYAAPQSFFCVLGFGKRRHWSSMSQPASGKSMTELFNVSMMKGLAVAKRVAC
jgi:hypothetical protein